MRAFWHSLTVFKRRLQEASNDPHEWPAKGDDVKLKSILTTPESLTTLALLIGSVLSLIFMSSLVAEPRVLFGRSLSAIPPSMFPSISLVIMAILCASALALIMTGTVAEQHTQMERAQWGRAILFFGILVLYALTMGPFGFLISTAIGVSLVSILMGARSVIQIGLVATIGPVALYLAATRLLAVSLPELVAIDVFYARALNLVLGQ